MARTVIGVRALALSNLQTLANFRHQPIFTSFRHSSSFTGGSSLVNSSQIHSLLKEVPFGGLQDAISVEILTAGKVRLRLTTTSENIRPGGSVSGPTLFTLADLTMWALVMTTRGPSALSVTTTATIDFLRRPAIGADLVAEGELLKDGKRLVVGRVSIFSDGVGVGEDSAAEMSCGGPVAHVTATYSVPPAQLPEK